MATSRRRPTSYHASTGNCAAWPARYLRGERPDHTLQATALVHEAYLRIIPNGNTDWKSRSHFFGVAAQQMRHILVDHDRQRQAAKRGGGERISLDDALFISPAQCDLVTDLDEALKSLAEFAPRAAKVVELKFFSGMTDEEVAEVLEVSTRTVKRDWKMARGWLDDNLSR